MYNHRDSRRTSLGDMRVFTHSPRTSLLFSYPPNTPPPHPRRLQENPEFDLHFEKVYRWVASSTAEKNSFISCIWKLNQRYLRKKVEFVNVSPQLLEGQRPSLYASLLPLPVLRSNSMCI